MLAKQTLIHSTETTRRVLATCLCIFAITMSAQSPMRPSETRYDWSGLAIGVAGDKTSKYDQAYAIYRWLCDNIAYDTSYSIYDSDNAYEQRRGVCQAYCELFYRIGETLGLQVDIISGKSKDRYGKISDMGHAWVFVYTNGNSGILIDPTWGAGSVDGKTFTRSKNDDSWFHVDPQWMIFTHFPDDEVYQLLDRKLDYSSFAGLPPIHPELSLFGFKGDKLLRKSLSGEKIDLPECYTKADIRVRKIPLEGTLRVGQSYDFALNTAGNYEFAVINAGDYHYDWTLSDNNHMTRFVPARGGKMSVSYRAKGSDDNWTTLAQYTVAKPTSADITRLESTAPHKSPVLTSLPGYNPERLKQRGIDIPSLLARVKKEGIKRLPKIYSKGDFHLNDVPMNGIIKAGRRYTFAFSPYEPGDWVIVNGNEWLRNWTQDPATKAWVMTFTPTSGPVVLVFKPQADTGKSYSHCVEYDVAN